MRGLLPETTTTNLAEAVFLLKQHCSLMKIEVIRDESDRPLFAMTFTHPEIELFKSIYKCGCAVVRVHDLSHLTGMIDLLLGSKALPVRRPL